LTPFISTQNQTIAGRNMCALSADVTDEPLKTFRMTLVLAIFRQFGNCFGLFDIAG
jgi:hypothetical protein